MILEEKNKWGGKREGAGRRPLVNGEHRKMRSLRATEEDKYIKQTACILKDGGVKAQKLKDFITSLNDT